MTNASNFKPLEGWQLWFAAIILSMANLIAILDMTIANVSVLSIAGGLAATPTQGTWVITSYAVAEAIIVPLTGFLVNRVGAVKLFVLSMIAFGVFSGVAALSQSLGFLVFARVLQGLAGGPLMPLSQTLLLKIFPKEKAGAATGVWAITTLVGPVLGPILGGWICDNYTWHWIFLINIPLAAVCSYIAWTLLKRYETKLIKSKIDIVGFFLLVLWVGALQIMLDEGKNLDWFSSPIIIGLAIVAFLGFIAFLIWEFTEEHPIVDLRIFRHRGFSVAVLTISLAFASLFAANVLTPLWLQSYMGYDATHAGMTTAWTGIVSLFIAPIAAGLSQKYDPRKLVFIGVTWLALVTLYRAISTTEMTYWQIAIPLMLTGLGTPFFFIPSTGAALGCVEESETASAAGLMNFMRTLAGAISTSLVSTFWENQITKNHAELVSVTNGASDIVNGFKTSGFDINQSMLLADRLITEQSVMLATNHLMVIVGFSYLLAALVIWLAPKPNRSVDLSKSH